MKIYKNDAEFNEFDYLEANPDVKQAVELGKFKTGWQHYAAFGKKECRKLKCSLDDLGREQKALYLIDKNGLGLEIGPSHNPLASKSKGFNVEIVDHLDANGLKEKYKDHQVNLNNIEEVDYVVDGRPLDELIGKKEYYDWIIASHVVEHVPNLVGFLQQCEKLLKFGGRLSLIIPDKRYCFDFFNNTTSTGQLLQAYNQNLLRPSSGQVFDHFSNAAFVNGSGAWSSSTTEKKELVHNFEFAKKMYMEVINSFTYIDVHCWRFTPISFRLIINDLQNLDLINLNIEKEFGTSGCEFYLTLKKEKNKNIVNRYETLMALVNNIS